MEAILACHPALSTEWLAGCPVYYDVCAPPPPPHYNVDIIIFKERRDSLFFVIAKIAQGSSMNFVRSLLFSAYYRKRGSASYIVHEVRLVRERERDGSDVTLVAMNFALFLAKMCTLVLAKSFARFLAKNFHLFLRLPSRMALSSHFPLPNTLHSSKQFAFFVASVKWCDRGSKHRTNDRISSCTVLLLIEKMNQINTRNYWK